MRGAPVCITGASRGIGAAMARAFAAEGCRLALLARNGTDLERLAGDLHGAADVLPVACDVRDEGSVADAARAVRERFGSLRVLVNNAGAAHGLARVEQLDVDVWRDVLNVNLTGTFLVTRAMLPLLEPGGNLVNNLSISAAQAFPGMAAYNAAKAGALALTNTLREELRPRRIRVTALIPGATRTEIWDQFWAEAPKEKMMDPASVARAVVDLVLLPDPCSVDEMKITPVSGAL